MIICTKCGLSFQQQKQICFCGSFSFAHIPDCIEIKKNVTSAKEILCSGGDEIAGFEFLGELPPIWLAMIHGKPGSGKSTFSFSLMDAIAKTKSERMVLYWSSEEGTKETVAKRIKLLGIESENLFFSSAKDKDKNSFISEIKNFRPFAIAIDSVQTAFLKVEDLLEIFDIANCITCFICQETKDGKYKGDSSYGHITDINILLEDGIARTEKNRFSGPSEMQVFEFKGDKENVEHA